MKLAPALAPLLGLALLAACGADGAPERPAAKPGITLSGEVKAGVTNSN